MVVWTKGDNRTRVVHPERERERDEGGSPGTGTGTGRGWFVRNENGNRTRAVRPEREREREQNKSGSPGTGTGTGTGTEQGRVVRTGSSGPGAGVCRPDQVVRTGNGNGNGNGNKGGSSCQTYRVVCFCTHGSLVQTIQITATIPAPGLHARVFGTVPWKARRWRGR